nr:hypothetical protein [Tanacetum cinerariifolium]
MVSKHFVNSAKSSEDKIAKNIDFKSCEKPVSQVEQIFLEELGKLRIQEKEANVAARKETTHENQDANTNSTNLLNDVSKPISTVGSSRALNDDKLHIPMIRQCLTLKIFMPVQVKGFLLIHLMMMKVCCSDKEQSEQVKLMLLSVTFRSNKETIIRIFNIACLLVSYLKLKPKRSLKHWKIKVGLMLYKRNFFSSKLRRIEAIRIFLVFASYMGFIVYQMDVKCAFLYGLIDEEVYVTQPLGLADPKFPNKVYKVVKALYGLHQAPKACLGDEFEELMKNKFQMSSMGELIFFLGLQVKQKEDGIFISQDNYVAEILKKFNFLSVKTGSTPIETHKPLVKDEEAVDVDVHLYRSMIGSLMYLTASRPDIMFAVCACSRFQTIVATSTIEAEYVGTAHCRGQVLWIQNQLLDYGFNIMNTKIYIDNESTICIVKNHVFHSKTKHIEIRHHFIRDAYEKKLIQVLKIHTDDNVADLLTKAFDVSMFNFLVVNIRLLNL